MIPYFCDYVNRKIDTSIWISACLELEAQRPIVILPLTMALTSVGQIIVVIGYSCASIQVAALPAVTSTYAIDSYKTVSGSHFVTIEVVKNLWGYGCSKYLCH